MKLRYELSVEKETSLAEAAAYVRLSPAKFGVPTPEEQRRVVRDTAKANQMHIKRWLECENPGTKDPALRDDLWFCVDVMDFHEYDWLLVADWRVISPYRPKALMWLNTFKDPWRFFCVGETLSNGQGPSKVLQDLYGARVSCAERLKKSVLKGLK